MRTFCFLMMMVATAAAQDAPCDPDHKGEFDFWIGEWDVFDTEGKQVGENVIKPLFGGCVLQETWNGGAASQGSSFNFYNPKTEAWQQFWVWQNGTTLELSGGLVDGSMVLTGTGKSRDGSTINNRITWTPNEDGSVRQHWEFSKDGGETYKTAFDGLYKKKS